MTPEERLRPIQKAVDAAFTKDVTLEEGRTMLRKMVLDLTIMLVVLDAKIAMAEEQNKTQH